MANKQEIPSGYMDDVKVKISEKYKPPPRISLAMSYAQRLSLNKQIQDSIPSYEFLLEKTVKEKMAEWRTARTEMSEELKSRLEKARSDEQKRREELLLKQKQAEEEEEAEENGAVTSTPLDSVASNCYLNSDPGQSYPFRSTNSSILIPTQTNSFSNILMPIPLQSSNENCTFKAVDKSPFNISDFEADTSSPFDNMELKSINDMEELAQVLKRDDTRYCKPNSNTPVISNTNSYMPNNQPSYSNYSLVGGGTNYGYGIPNSSSQYVQPVNSAYSNSNGYYYPPETIPTNSFYSTPYAYTNHVDALNYGTSSVPTQNSKIPTFRSVPDIMKTLQTELDNTHMDNTKPVANNASIEQPLRPKSTDAVYPRPRAKTRPMEDPEDVFTSLPKNVQDMSKSISSMGFPLLRVVRVCQVLGNDQKKVVEHLLAMSELLDLGFSEANVSKALLQCNNDRDKALDILIS